MSKFKEFDPGTTLANQMESKEGPIVLMNIFTVDSNDEDALLKAWTHDAEFMKKQPGYISTQLHKGIGESTSYFNYAVWDSVESFRSAFSSPEFQKRIAAYPESAIASPHLFKKLAVPNFCTE